MTKLKNKPKSGEESSLPQSPEEFLQFCYSSISNSSNFESEQNEKKRNRDDSDDGEEEEGPKLELLNTEKPDPAALRLPDSVVKRILDKLDEVSATSLGVTHRNFYNVFKTDRPLPVPLDRSIMIRASDGSDSGLALSELLKDWMEPRYRYSKELNRFLNKKIYQEQNSTREQALVWVSKKVKGNPKMLWSWKKWFDIQDGWSNEKGYKTLFLKWADEINDCRTAKGLEPWVPCGLILKWE
ncbi:hypothetical protein PVAG01_06300 [Phlyctema vagabunda]|uniref:F-box domain-containing protein n=1 Tax=Phlyctema vagabunda TaxID=108571 RepID=A0ABR4PFT5_9HELO